MNFLSPLKNILRSVIRKIDDLIEQMPARQTKIIGQTFWGVVIILAIIGAFWGMRLGGGAAGVKAPPLASNVREVFEYEINKTNRGGNFDFLIESERMSGLESRVAEKIEFPSREPLDMEYEGGIVDYRRDRRLAAPEMQINQQPLEGRYAGPMGRTESYVAPLDRRPSQNTDILKNDAKRTDLPSINPLETIPLGTTPLEANTPEPDSLKTEFRKPDVPINEKRTSASQDQEPLRPITDGTGILE
ncbi:MAG: hypothetical protein FWG92_06720 [Leptospirales bacterium]|nr:hypothetical protein [Leptospirales bacterium]